MNAAAMNALRANYTAARDALAQAVTDDGNRIVDAKKDPHKTKFLEAAFNSRQLAPSTEAPTADKVNFTYLSTVMTPELWVLVLREALLRDRNSVMLGHHGAEIPGPILIQLRTMLQGMYTKARNDHVNELIEGIVSQTVDIARRLENTTTLSPEELFIHFRFALRCLNDDIVALKTDQLHKEANAKTGQRYAQLKRHRLEQYAYGDAELVKALGKTGEKE